MLFPSLKLKVRIHGKLLTKRCSSSPQNKVSITFLPSVFICSVFIQFLTPFSPVFAGLNCLIFENNSTNNSVDFERLLCDNWMTRNFVVFTASAPYFTHTKKNIEKRKKSYWRQTSALFDVTIWCEDIRISFLTGISETLLDTS